jgi:hypothetical protein
MLEGLEPPKSKSVYCKVSQTLEKLEDNDAAILIAALADVDRWGAKTLQNALRERGLSLSDTTIAKHRNKTCACYRG